MTNPLGEIIEESSAEELAEFTRSLLEELEYLRYFFSAADFGPAHSDVVWQINQDYYGKIPKGYQEEDDD